VIIGIIIIVLLVTLVIWDSDHGPYGSRYLQPHDPAGDDSADNRHAPIEQVSETEGAMQETAPRSPIIDDEHRRAEHAIRNSNLRPPNA
jgi:hypothetical protein